MNAPPTQDRVNDLLNYDPTTGVFTWRVARRGLAKKGTVAGAIDSKGYRQIKVDGVLYLAHRLAWLAMTGDWPESELDHKDCDRTNNRFRNLRLATATENRRNRTVRKDCRHGLKGVMKKNGRYAARIRADGREIWLGTYNTKQEAHDAYIRAAINLHGDFARVE